MNRLTLRIAITLYILLGLFVGGTGFYIKNHLERETTTLLTSSMQSIAAAISDDISGVYIDYLLSATRGGEFSKEIESRLKRFAGHFKLTEVTICDTSLIILSSTDSLFISGMQYYPLLASKGKLNRILSGITVATPVYESNKELFMSVYLPISGENGTKKAILSVEASAEYFNLLMKFESFFIYIGIALAIILLVGAWFISSQLTNPIREMSIVAKKIGEGELGAAVNLPLFRDEIRTLAVSINSMSVRLRDEHQKNIERVEGLRILAAGVAHEVRNPVQGISLYADKLRRNTVDPSVAETAVKIKNEIRQIERIISDLLDYTKELNLTVSTFNVSSLLQEVLSANGVQAMITGNCRREAVGDRLRLKQVFMNVVRNGVEAAIDGRVNIAVHLTFTENIVDVEIHNAGKEVDEEIVKKLFQPFFTTKAKGTGLGLALCRKIMTAHSGAIEIKRSERSGYTTCVNVQWKNQGVCNGNNTCS
jgi:signal transduction histidine kinase